MRYSTTLVVAALSVGQTMAGPTHAHLHRHREVHEKKDVDWAALDWDNMGIDWSSAWAAGQHSSTAAPVAAATPAASPIIAAESKATSTPAAKSNSVSDTTSSTASLWNGLKGLSNSRTAFGQPAVGGGSEVGALGNIGNPQGSNMIKVPSADGYPFTNTFINTSPSSMTVVLWNKAYSNDGSINTALANLGSCVAPSTPALTFALAPGAQQVVAFQDGTLLGWSQAVDGKTPAGAFATTWGEAKFTTTEGSGYDMSAIVNPNGNSYNMAISSSETSCISDPTQNYWEGRNNNPEDPIPIGTSDGSCYVPGTTATLVTKMGGNM